MSRHMVHPGDEDLRLLRIDQVRDLIPIGRSTLYRWIDKGEFPQPVKAEGIAMWRNIDIRAWLSRRCAAGRSNEDLI